MKEKIEELPIEPDKFDKRAQVFWGEMFGLLRLLNSNNDKVILRTVESPVITNYLLWRLLGEIKLSREADKLSVK